MKNKQQYNNTTTTTTTTRKNEEKTWLVSFLSIRLTDGKIIQRMTFLEKKYFHLSFQQNGQNWLFGANFEYKIRKLRAWVNFFNLSWSLVISIQGICTIMCTIISKIWFLVKMNTTVKPRSCESEGTECFFLKNEFFSGVRWN